jgi:hypothetical protein
MGVASATPRESASLKGVFAALKLNLAARAMGFFIHLKSVVVDFVFEVQLRAAQAAMIVVFDDRFMLVLFTDEFVGDVFGRFHASS